MEKAYFMEKTDALYDLLQQLPDSVDIAAISLSEIDPYHIHIHLKREIQDTPLPLRANLKALKDVQALSVSDAERDFQLTQFVDFDDDDGNDRDDSND